jgi:endoglucanase
MRVFNTCATTAGLDIGHDLGARLDRNLYVDAAMYNGTPISGANLQLYRNNTKLLVLAESLNPVLQYEGVVLNGGEFNSDSNLDDWSNNSPDYGGLGSNYTYPNTQEIDYFVSTGMNTFKVPFHAQNLLDETKADDIRIITELVDYAASKGAIIIIGPHDFGYTYTGKLIGHDAGSVAEFASEWTSIASVFKDKQNVMFLLMTEPNKQTATEWLQGANAAIQAIRDTGATQKILVPGSYWSGGWSWVSSDNDTVVGLGVKDPLHNYAFEVHQYLDADFSGSNNSVVHGSGSTTLQEVTDWARSHGEELFLGEFGFASDAASITEGKALNDFTHANSDVWIGQTYWGAGPWWGDYMFSIEPTGLGTATVTDKPQMSVLDDYLLLA